MDDIRLSISNLSPPKRPHIICVSETWLHSAVSDNHASIPNYTIFRDDRLTGRGGGVAIWVIDYIVSTRINYTHVKPSFIEFVALYISKSNLLVLTLYIPPKHSNSTNDCKAVSAFTLSVIDDFLIQHPTSSVFLCGDFNNFDVNPICDHLGLVNIVKVPTRFGSNSTLDYAILSENLAERYSLTVEPPFANSDHKNIKCSPSNSIKKRNFYKRLVYDCRQSNVAHLIDCISGIDWQLLIDLDADVNVKCKIFHETVYDCFTSCIPSQEVHVSDTDPPWFTPVLKVLINRRWEAFRSGNHQQYTILRDKVKTMISRAKASWAKRSCTNSRFLWQTANSVSGYKSNNSMNSLYCKYTDSNSAADHINSALCGVFQQDTPIFNDASPLNYDWNINITPLCILNALDKYDSKKAYGSDLVPTFLYKAIAPFICVPLAHIFNLSVSTCTFPDLWKKSHVICLPKCSRPTIDDIRPISLLALPSKIFEKFVYNSLRDNFNANFGPTQFGFRPKSSTTHALISLHDFATRSLDRPDVNGIQLISYDFSKAFDKAAHSVILNNLTICQFPRDFVSWVNSYLCDRTQSVRIGAVTSTARPVTSGVPQGSVLGPAFFSIMISSFSCLSSEAHCIKFADDITILFPLFRDSLNNNYIGDEHIHFKEWSKTKKLFINDTKCKSLLINPSKITNHFFINDIPFVNEIKLLGVILNSQLNFNSHISYIVSRCSCKLFALRIVSRFLSTHHCINIYQGLIRSVLEYCSPVFVGLGANNSQKLENIQSRAHRIICGPSCDCNKFVSLAKRRIAAATKLFVESASSTDSPIHCILPSRSSHNSNRFVQPPSFSARRFNSFVPFTCNNINLTM